MLCLGSSKTTYLINVSALSDARFREEVKLCAASAAGRLRPNALTGN